MSDQQPRVRPRTAPALGAFYRELKEEGIPDELAYEIVRDAARHVTTNRIGVKAPAQEVSA